MTSKPFRRLTPIIYLILFFFCWTNLGIYNIAYAAAKGSGQGSVAGGQQKTKTPEEKFQESLERLRDAVGKEDSAKIKAERTELEKLDVEIKKQFKETETKIKGLPEAVKQRHRDFVKKYEDNLSTLKVHLDNIEKAKTKEEKEQAHRKAKEFLEKAKQPKRHVPLDPNKLPNRTREKKQAILEEWKEPEKPPMLIQPLKRSEIQKQQPILVAANGPLKGLLNSDDTQLLAENYIQVAQTTSTAPVVKNTEPTSDDLQETPETKITPAIRAKAAELGNQPLKIYEWVRNNIEYVPTYGSIQGADMCLQTKQCNDFDAASLLIALFRASNISARYIYGTIELPIEKVLNWVGGATDPRTAANILATNGIPAKVLVSGGTVKAVQMEHVWVEAWIDYIPSRGAKHYKGDTWIPLDPSFKQYNYTTGIDIKTAVTFDAQSFINQLQSTATINETEGYVTNVSSTLVQQATQDYQTRVQNYITQNYPNATVGDVLGKKEIIKQAFGILPCTLPYKTIIVGSKFAEIGAQYRATMSFNVPDQSGLDTGLAYTTTLPQIAGKKITLSFSPATANDAAIINTYLPQPHPDGTPIQPSELPTSLPAYLINLKPELRIDGQVVATGVAITMGSALSFTMSLNEPGFGISNIDNIITAGEYFGIGLDTGRIGTSRLNALKTRMEATKAKLAAQNYTALTKDDLVGDRLYATIAGYFAELDVIDEFTARSMDIIRQRGLSLGMFSLALDVKEAFGVPISAQLNGMRMDVDHIVQAVFSKDGDMAKTRQYMLVSGHVSSTLEHALPEKLYSTEDKPTVGMSAVKALQMASMQGIPIYTINQSNIDTILPQLQVGELAKVDIVNAVHAGKIVTVSKANVNLNGWIGCGYIIIDPATGSGAYMISGGLSGFWSLIGAYFAAISDLLTESVNSGYIQRTPVMSLMQSLANFLAALGYVLTVVDILNNPNLTPLQQITEILIWLGALWLMIGVIAPWAAAAFAPVLGLLVITFLYVCITWITLLLVSLIESQSYYEFNRYRSACAYQFKEARGA